MINFRSIIILATLMVTIFGCDNRNKTAVPEGITILSGDVTYTLDNAEEVHKQHPDTFWIPAQDIRGNLKVGQLVKLLFRISNGSEDQVERMWVEIVNTLDDKYEGILDNVPYCTKNIAAGLKVNFQAKHVIEIYEYDPSN